MTLIHRGQNTDHRMHRSTGDIRHRHTHNRRAITVAAGVAIQPRDGEIVIVVTGAVAIGPSLAVASYRTVNQFGVDLTQLFIAET